jgi:hypothetical protein
VTTDKLVPLTNESSLCFNVVRFAFFKIPGLLIGATLNSLGYFLTFLHNMFLVLCHVENKYGHTDPTIEYR